MRIQASVDYAGSPDEVFSMLTDEEFQRRKCAATGALNQSVSVERRGEGAVVTTKRTMPTDNFPDFVKSMVGQTIIVTETTTWGPPAADGSRDGRLVVDLGGGPIALSADVHLAPSGAGTAETVDGELKAKIPLVGGKIEKAAAPAIESAIRVERTVGSEWLAAR